MPDTTLAIKNKAAPSHGTASTPPAKYNADARYSPQICDVLAALRHLPPFQNLIEPVGFVLKTLAKDRLEEHRMFNAWQDWAISCRSFDLGNSRAVWRGMGGGIKK